MALLRRTSRKLNAPVSPSPSFDRRPALTTFSSVATAVQSAHEARFDRITQTRERILALEAKLKDSPDKHTENQLLRERSRLKKLTAEHAEHERARCALSSA